jgi:hypothetical protein
MILARRTPPRTLSCVARVKSSELAKLKQSWCGSRCRKAGADRLLVHQRQAAGERGAAGGRADVARGHHQQSVHPGRAQTPVAQHLQVPGVQHQNDAAQGEDSQT